MADVWKAELSFDGYSYTPTPNPTGIRAGWFWIGLEAVCLPIADAFPASNPPIDEGGFAIFTGYADGSTFLFPAPGAFQIVTMRLGSSESRPQQWSVPFIVGTISGGDPALIVAGGTLSIEKDFAGNQMTFTGPLGTQTCSLSDIDLLPGGPYGYNNATPLRPRGYGEFLIFPDPTGLDPAYDITDSVAYYDLIGKQNGVAYDTVALSSGDPGTWWPTYSDAFVTGVGTIFPGLSPWWTYTQFPVRQEWDVAVLAADYPIWSKFITYRRRMVPSNDAADMINVVEHGPFYAAIVYSSDPTTVKVRKTYDNGTSWLETTLYSSGGTTNTSPTIATANGRLVAAWEQSGSLLQSGSNDLGVSWSTPVTLFSGTNPRLIVDPRHKVAFYFYVDSGDLKLVRSGNFGADYIDGTPITVAASVGQQTVTAAFAADGSIVVGYITAGAWTQVRSRDYGISWS
jgi:hypothetical protein